MNLIIVTLFSSVNACLRVPDCVNEKWKELQKAIIFPPILHKKRRLYTQSSFLVSPLKHGKIRLRSTKSISVFLPHQPASAVPLQHGKQFSDTSKGYRWYRAYTHHHRIRRSFRNLPLQTPHTPAHHSANRRSADKRHDGFPPARSNSAD